MTLADTMQLAFLGMGGGMALTGICWIVGMAVSYACNIIGKN